MKSANAMLGAKFTVINFYNTKKYFRRTWFYISNIHVKAAYNTLCDPSTGAQGGTEVGRPLRDFEAQIVQPNCQTLGLLKEFGLLINK